MTHDELVEVLTRLTNEIAGLKASVDENTQNLGNIQGVLATWDHDQRERESVLSERIERQRERLKSFGDRLRKLDGSKADIGGE
jgi:BMFP domain-containing protein YqiC